MAEHEDESEPGSPSTPDEGEAADEREADEPAEAAEPSAAPRPKKKKKKPVEASDEPARDRNQRLREQAASARKKQREVERAPARNLDTSEIVDDALARSTQAAGNFLKRNFNVVQWLLVGGIVIGVGYEIYTYRVGKQIETASDALSVAITAEQGRIGSEDPGVDPQTGLDDSRPGFASAAERRTAAEKQYREVASSSSSSGAAVLAKLGLAAVLYDEGKYLDAKAAYEDVKKSTLAQQDVDVKGRAVEGIGMSLESAGQADAANKAFQELENLDTAGFGALGAYHQARLAFAAGKTAEAKTLLERAQKKLDVASEGSDKNKPFQAPGYLKHAILELVRAVDPNAVAATPNALTAEQLNQLGSMGDDNGGGMSQEKLNQMLKEIAKHAKDTPAAPGAPPAPPASAP